MFELQIKVHWTVAAATVGSVIITKRLIAWAKEEIAKNNDKVKGQNV